jgi:Skp family chaperone for outer membrane proteins
MNKSFVNTAMVLGGVAILAASGAQAQQQVTPAPGAALPGVCVYSENVVVSTSSAGVAATAKLNQIQQSIAGQLNATRGQIDADNKALGPQKATLPAATYQQKVTALQQRAQDWNTLAQTRNAQFTHTRELALTQIANASVPLLNASVAAHRCSIVIDRGATYTSNATMDLTAEVIQKLNASMPSISFELAAPAK